MNVPDGRQLLCRNNAKRAKNKYSVIVKQKKKKGVTLTNRYMN
jgi:hypothetical protein